MSRRKPVVLFVVDGLRHRDYQTELRIMPEAGFRHAEASLFTGEPAAQLGVWTDYRFSPSSPFRTACRAPGLSVLWKVLRREQTRYLNFLIYRLSEMLTGTTLPRSSLIPPHLLAQTAPTQLTAPDAPNAYGDFDSLFDLLRDQNRSWLYLAPPHISPFGARDSLVERKLYKALRKRNYDFYYVKLSDLDKVSHIYGPDSPEAAQCRKATYRRIESMRSELLHAHGDLRWVLLSDHGFVTVNELIETPSWLEEYLAQKKLVYYFIDSTILRMWVHTTRDRGDVRRRMSAIRGATPLDDGTRTTLGLQWGSSHVGHLSYLCMPGKVFWPDFFSVRPPRGMHGYSPTDDLASPVESHGMPPLPKMPDHALVGQALKQALGEA